MKKFFLALFLSYFSHTVFAQDIIKLVDGSTVEAKVLEITQTEIKYKKFRNLDGPLYTIGKHEASTITYAYGEVEEYGAKSVPKQISQSTAVADTEANSSASPQLIELDPDDENARIIKRSQNNNLSHSNPNKQNYNNHATKWAITESSVISNSQVKAVFEHYERKILCQRCHFHNLTLVNKLDVPIYIDLGSSFCTTNGTSRCYYDPSTIVSGNKSGMGGVGVNIGGINVGGAAGGGYSTAYQDQRFVVVSPRGKGYVSQWRWLYNSEVISKRPEGGVFSTNSGKLVSVGECFDVVGNALGQLYGFRTNKDNFYTEANSPLKKEYYITYSTDPDFRTYSVLKFTVYLHQTIGSKREDAVWYQDTGININNAYIYTHGVFSSTYEHEL